MQQGGYTVTVIDVKSGTGAVPVSVVQGDIADEKTWETALAAGPVAAVFHCAGLIQVEESMREPGRYFRENVAKSIAMLGHLRSVPSVPIIFSSSAAVYGTPDTVPITETAALRPKSAYGVTKRQFEEVLAWHYRVYGQRYGILMPRDPIKASSSAISPRPICCR